MNRCGSDTRILAMYPQGTSPLSVSSRRTKVIGSQEVGEVHPDPVTTFAAGAFDGRVLDGPVEAAKAAARAAAAPTSRPNRRKRGQPAIRTHEAPAPADKR